MCFLYFFAKPLDITTTARPSDYENPYDVRCDEPIPKFTLDMDIIPNNLQADAICSCIWKKLSASDQNLSASLARNDNDNASEGQLKLFNSRIDVAMEICKAEGLQPR